MKTTIAYYRVSTQDQSVAMQRRDIQLACEAKGIRLDHQEYIDHGISGARASRPALDQLLLDIKQRQIGTVMVWSLSRLGRSLKHLLTLLEEFESCGVSLISIKEGWDLATPSGRMIFQVLGALSEWEREQIRERVRGGLRAARARGSRLGRPTVPYDQAQIVNLREKGLSCREIAKEIGVSRQTVSRVLSQNRRLSAAANF